MCAQVANIDTQKKTPISIFEFNIIALVTHARGIRANIPFVKKKRKTNWNSIWFLPHVRIIVAGPFWAFWEILKIHNNVVCRRIYTRYQFHPKKKKRDKINKNWHKKLYNSQRTASSQTVNLCAFFFHLFFSCVYVFHFILFNSVFDARASPFLGVFRTHNNECTHNTSVSFCLVQWIMFPSQIQSHRIAIPDFIIDFFIHFSVWIRWSV